MASGSMYHNPSLSRWADDTPDLVHDDRSLAFTPAPRGGHHAYPRPPMQPDGFQVWIPPPNAFYDPYDTPQTQPSRPLPILASEAGSPPPLSRRSLINDPAFAVDPHLNPHNWIGNYAESPAQTYTNASATTVLQFPLPRVPSFPASEASTRAAPIPVPASTAPSRPQSYAPDRSAPSTPYEAGHVYLIPPSTAPSASSASSSSGRSTPSSERRSPDRSSRAHDTRQEPIYIAPTDISTPRTRHGKASEARTERHTRQQPRPPPSYAETVSSSGTDDASPRVIEEKPRPVVLSYHPPDDSAQPDIPPPPRQPAPSQSQPSSSERPPERTRRKSASRPGAVPLKDLDSIDELDETTPYGIAVHHKGPYEAIAAMLGQRRPLELSPDGAPIELEPVDDDFPASRPGRRHKPHSSSHPHPSSANPMVLNLKPGQILKGSIYQPPSFPLARAPATYPPDHYMAAPQLTSYPSTSDSPLRRNQTLPAQAASAPRMPMDRERSYRMPEPAPQMEQRRSHTQYRPSDPRAYQPLMQSFGPSSEHAPRDGLRTMPEPARRESQIYANATGNGSGNVQDRRSYYDNVPPPDMRRDPPPMSRRQSAIYPSEMNGSRQSGMYQQPTGRGSGSFAPAPPPSWPEQGYQNAPSTNYIPPPISRPDSFFEGPPAPSRAPPPPQQFHPSPPPQVNSRPPPQPSRHSPPSSRPPPPPTPQPQSQPELQPQPQAQRPSAASQPPRRYEPPSQALATMNQNRPPAPDIHIPPPSVHSSSTQSSALQPSHVPRRLVMPAPLAPHPEHPPPEARLRFAENPRAANVPTAAQGQGHQRKASTVPIHHGAPNLLRKRSAPAALPEPEPQRGGGGGLLAFFGFGSGKSGAKTQVKQVRVVEPRAMNGVRPREREVYDVRDEKGGRRLTRRN